jgi:hypothetical protein
LRRSGALRKGGDPQALEHETQRALMLINRRRAIALSDLRTDDRPLNLPASMCAVSTLVEHDDQHAVAAGLEHIGIEQRRDVGV